MVGILVAVSLAALVVVGALWLAGLWTYAGHDRIELIDDPRVAEPAERACARMVAALPAPAAGSQLDLRARVMRQENAAVMEMVRAVRALGTERLEDDHPTLAWLDDWEALVRLREEYATNLAAGRPATLVLPTIDGYPITHRMNDVGLDCQVPPRLVDLP
ncbi:hypothetical protein [Actinopolymorpha alba]|uniref:hypothetical protein n=1 Tax=Actinopolymorpha alba TaxID=533267 RepID=UPI0012F6ECBF|nr:hypothetical protein [Actinopolymorpha alba]